MAYIKFILKNRRTDDTGKATRTIISRFESDMADTRTLETNLYMHALAIKGKVQQNKGFVYTFPITLTEE
jgi:hypothetical protein